MSENFVDLQRSRKTNTSLRKLPWLLSAALLLGLSFPQMWSPSSAQSEEEQSVPFLEKRYTMGSDFILALNVTMLDRMLNYPTSSLAPIAQLRVMVFLRDPRTKGFQPGQLYEDLWFSNGRPIGCKRYMNLPVQNGSYGVIALVRSKDSSSQTRAAIDACLRLFVEVSRIKCLVTSMILPLEACDNAGSDLGSFNFYQAQVVTAGRVLLLHVSSTPYGFDKYFQYSIK